MKRMLWNPILIRHNATATGGMHIIFWRGFKCTLQVTDVRNPLSDLLLGFTYSKIKMYFSDEKDSPGTLHCPNQIRRRSNCLLKPRLCDSSPPLQVSQQKIVL